MQDSYAVFGNPITHSVSPQIHNLFAQQCRQDMDYTKEAVELDLFEERVKQFFHHGGKGLNITIPFKERAFALADHSSHRAMQAQSANTLYYKDSCVYCDNTDGKGFISDITARLGWQLQGARVLILGAGGSVKAILPDIVQAKPAECIIANRTYQRAEQLVQIYAENTCTVRASTIDALSVEYDYVINATAVSLSSDTITFPKQIISENSRCYDLAYDLNSDTHFCLWAQSCGAQCTSDGLGMLVGQAAESFYIWRQCMPNIETVLAQLRR